MGLVSPYKMNSGHNKYNKTAVLQWKWCKKTSNACPITERWVEILRTMLYRQLAVY